MKSIELSHIALVFLSEFVKQHKHCFDKDSQGNIKFLKSNAKERLKLIDKTIDSLSSKK